MHIASIRQDTIPAAASLQHSLAPFTRFLEEPGVNEVTANRPGTLWVLRENEWREHKAPELTESWLLSLIQHAARFNDVNIAAVMMNIDLPGGERGTAVSSEALMRGYLSFTARKPLVVPKSVEQLDDEGAFSSFTLLKRNDIRRLEPVEEELLALLHAGELRRFIVGAVQSHRNIVVSGAFGSGKSTLLNSIAGIIPSDERLISIQNVDELKLPHKNYLALKYGDGRTSISSTQALRATTRLTPKRLILGETSGPEAWDLFSLLNTGTPGSMVTVHANSAREVKPRLINLIRLSEAGRSLPLDYLQNVLDSVVDVVLHVHQRRVIDVYYDPEAKNAANCNVGRTS